MRIDVLWNLQEPSYFKVAENATIIRLFFDKIYTPQSEWLTSEIGNK